jgi:transcriptional regulator with AAA-type ATPase domain
MIDKIKEKIWDLLKDKAVSLAMIFDSQGDILWHRGRDIAKSRKVSTGAGYSASWIKSALKDRRKLIQTGCAVNYVDLSRSNSANALNIKSLAILPFADQYYLYIDSGSKTEFSDKDLTVFETLASLLGGIINNVQSGFGLQKKISGGSKQAAAIREKIAKYAIEEEPVLLLGETGVGKSFIAELIHTYSGRPGPFVVVNTPGIPGTLLEAQLFGHVKGAFTGAISDSQGFVAAALGGTLFLDEIAELEPALQAKLLRFIDTQMYHRVGDASERKAEVRILAATNQDLKAALLKKTFREDLYFRLNCLCIDIPPLRERREDIRIILDDNNQLLRGKTLTAEAIDILLNYAWPGNIRELLRVLRVAGIQFDGLTIGREIHDILLFPESKNPEANSVLERTWQEMQSGKTFWEAVKKPYLSRDLNREQVLAIINRGLQGSGGKYAGLLKTFNLDDGEYKNFMSFLYDNHLRQVNSKD